MIWWYRTQHNAKTIGPAKQGTDMYKIQPATTPVVRLLILFSGRGWFVWATSSRINPSLPDYFSSTCCCLRKEERVTLFLFSICLEITLYISEMSSASKQDKRAKPNLLFVEHAVMQVRGRGASISDHILYYYGFQTEDCTSYFY